jgi:hypothetical protein
MSWTNDWASEGMSLQDEVTLFSALTVRVDNVGFYRSPAYAPVARRTTSEAPADTGHGSSESDAAPKRTRRPPSTGLPVLLLPVLRYTRGVLDSNFG